MKRDEEKAVKQAAPTRRLWFSQRGLWRSPDEGAPAPAQDQAPATPTPGGKQGDTTAGGFTQEQIDRLAGNARKEGREAGVKALLEELGLADLETLKGKVQVLAQKEEADKTELQKVADKLTRAEAKSVESLQKANRLIVKTKAEALASQRGLDPEKVGQLLATMGGLDGFKVDLETGEVEGLVALFDTLAAIVGTPETSPENGQQAQAQQGAARKPFVQQNSGGGQPAKRNPAQDYISKTYAPRKS
jgi:hypothetical protein